MLIDVEVLDNAIRIKSFFPEIMPIYNIMNRGKKMSRII